MLGPPGHRPFLGCGRVLSPLPLTRATEGTKQRMRVQETPCDTPPVGLRASLKVEGVLTSQPARTGRRVQTGTPHTFPGSQKVEVERLP